MSEGGVDVGDIGRWWFDKRRLGVKGDVLRAPACENLRTYPVRVENGRVLIGL